MPRHVELTKDSGKRFGIPSDSALIIIVAGEADREKHPKAQCFVRYSMGMGQHGAQYVRDSFKHLLTLFPHARGGAPWAHGVLVTGEEIAIPNGSVHSYEEDEEDGVAIVILELEGQSVGPLRMKATLEEIRAMAGGDVQAAPAVKAEAPPRKRAPRAKGGEGGGKPG